MCRRGVLVAIALVWCLMTGCTSGGSAPTPGAPRTEAPLAGTARPSGRTVVSPSASGQSRPSGHPAPVPRGALIAFHADPGGNDDTYLMRADGSHVVGLTLRKETIARPFWSPDGTRLALECCTFSMDEILVVKAGGTGLREVSGGVPDATAPAWSPDGRHIAFESTSRRGIYLVDVDTPGRPAPHRLVAGAGATWAPDGRHIAFFRPVHGNPQILVVDLADGRTRQLTRSPASDVSPTWSPDGRHIAFLSDRNGDEDVWVMDVEGRHQVDISRDRDPDESISWSPDGRWLAYVDYRRGADPHAIGQGDAEVVVVGAGGSGKRDVTNSPAWEGDPDWSPDGRLLAFTRRTDHAEIFTIRPDGTGERSLRGTEGEANDCCPAWRPK